MNYTTGEIAHLTQSQLMGEVDLHIRKIAFDSRNIYSTQNTAFIAIKTSKNNGEKYIQSAVDKGIKIIISENKTLDNLEITWIIVANTLEFLQNLAKIHLNHFPELKTIGITGSNGKTIIKEWLYQSIMHDRKVVKSPKSFNSQLGLPLSLLEINSHHELGIFEVGISKKGEMENLEKIFSPKIGILSHIGSAHIDNFENEQALILEKLLLFQHTETIIYNGDNPMVMAIVKEKFSDRHLISFGFGIQNDVHISGNWQDKTKNLTIQCKETELELPVEKRDTATLTNALAVMATLHFLGYKNKAIIDKINALRAVEMRLESVVGVRGNTIINDSFNLDLDSLAIAYQFVNEYKKAKKALVLTDFVEGKNIENFYSEVAKLTNEQNFDTIFLIGEEIAQYQNAFSAATFSFENTEKLMASQELNQISDAIILLKGARKFEIERVKLHLELQKHDTVLEVNLNAILHNINIHKSQLKPETKMMAMVKAYSYGLGGYEIAEFLQHHHIDYLGVAFADEGMELRKNGITTPIIVMNPEQHSYQSIIDYNLEPEIYSFRVLDLFYDQYKINGLEGKYPIHIKLETGMHRLGFKKEEIPELIQKLKIMDVKVKSIFSHLSTSDLPNEKEFTLGQIKNFDVSSSLLIEGLGYQPIRHILNSAGIDHYPEYQYDMVRIGIGMLGLSGNPAMQAKLQRTVSFKTVISQISLVEKGESVGYNRNYKTNDVRKIATIPVGYADGIPRAIGNLKGKVGIHGQLVPIVGNVCMDMMMIDVSNIEAKEGDEVILFNGTPSLENFSEYCNTIPYEVLTSISRRVKRIYIKN